MEELDGDDWANLFGDFPLGDVGRRQVLKRFTSGHVYDEGGGERVV